MLFEVNGLRWDNHKFSSSRLPLMFERHPSARLNELFRHRPYQGAEPSKSTFLFVGLDANYDRGIDQSAAFDSVVEYHLDGVAFWKRHGVHHPFLLPGYSGDGRRYHRTFSKIGFTADDAATVSFVELVHAPTVGRNKLTVDDLDPSHLRWLDELILRGEAKHVFISAGVARLMFASKAFSWMSARPTLSDGLATYRVDGSRTVYAHLHFSNYGKFQERLDLEAQAIAKLIAR